VDDVSEDEDGIDEDEPVRHRKGRRYNLRQTVRRRHG
jgi:hypothetical protein